MGSPEEKEMKKNAFPDYGTALFELLMQQQKILVRSNCYDESKTTTALQVTALGNLQNLM